MCNDNTTCQSCLLGYGLIDNACTPCPDNCLFCSTANECDLCLTPANLIVDNRTCQTCPDNCVSCIWNETNCTTCVQGYFELFGKCVACSGNCSLCAGSQCYQCDPGFFLNGVDCAPCMDNCSFCSNTTVCDQCALGYYLQGDGTCGACLDNCVNCVNNVTCIECNPGYVGLNFAHNFTCIVCPYSCNLCFNEPEFICYPCLDGVTITRNLTNYMLGC